MASDIQPGLLRRMTVRSIFEKLQQNGPLSRADLTRETGISAPTVSKVVTELIVQGFIEETEISENLLGRPGKRLRMAKARSRVAGVTIGQFSCGVVTAALDGEVDLYKSFNFPTPSSYQSFIELAADCIAKIQASENFNMLGMGICVPGLISRQDQVVVHSTLAPFLVGRSLSTDLAKMTGVRVATRQQGHAMAIAERLFGQAKWLRDFVLVDAAEGPTLGVYSNGDLLSGQDGLAGQLTLVNPLADNGTPDATISTDANFLAAIARRVGRTMTLDQVWQEFQSGALDLEFELDAICASMAKVVASTINLFNPSNLFLYSRILAFDVTLLSRISDLARSLTLDPSFNACRILSASVSTQDAAIAAITESLAQSLGPRLS